MPTNILPSNFYASRVNREHECALQKQLNYRFYKQFISVFEHKSTIYRRKEDLIRDFTKFEDLNFNYFQYMFSCGFGFHMLLILIYLSQKIYQKLAGAWRKLVRSESNSSES